MGTPSHAEGLKLETIKILFERGGYPVMTSITICLIIAIVIIIERTYRFWFVYDLANTQAFMAHIQKMIMNNSIENAIRSCKKMRPKLLPYVLSEGLKRSNDSSKEIENALEHATLAATPKVMKMVPLLGTIANVATLLGLLGTLFGLMKSFAAAANATGAQKQTLLAEGIAEALTATSFGLSTALICLLAFGGLSWKQSSIVDGINQHGAKLLDLLYTRKQKLKR